eukprot:8132120-Karenia_brevis.AAC.1
MGIRFKANTIKAAERKRDRAWQWIRNGGQWRELFITTPSDEKVRLYINFDKSDKQIRTETLTKRLFSACQAAYSSHTFKDIRSKG